MEPLNTEPVDDITKLVPTKRSYILAFAVLFLSGLAGIFIGYALMKVFFGSINNIVIIIGTCLISAGIIYGVNVIVSLGLQASVEWNARSYRITDRTRPSYKLNQQKK